MDVEFDPVKDKENQKKHGLAFSSAAQFDFDSALIAEDTRRDYGEVRYQALGDLQGKIALFVFTMRGPERLRVISLRPANRKERKLWQSGE